MGDPAKGSKKHTVDEEILIASEGEAVRLIRDKGYSLRVETTTRPSLVRLNIFQDGTKLT